MASLKKIAFWFVAVSWIGQVLAVAEEIPIIRMLDSSWRQPDQLTPIRAIGLEEYTLGVMQKEIAPGWPLEVLKAQAVLIRTNAVWAYLRNSTKPYHLTRYSPQVYEYHPQSPPSVSAAVEETRGLVLKYKDRIIPAYFHSVCGGGTEAAKNVWHQEHPYPAAVACNFCKDAPKFRWTSRLSLTEFRSRLNAAGLSLGPVQDVFASSLGAVSDRVTEIVIEHTAGKTLIPSGALRRILGNNEIKSTNFSVAREGEMLVFRGHGWGHGVGLCQWGAKAMAASGKGFEDILKFYFPGVRIARVKE